MLDAIARSEIQKNVALSQILIESPWPPYQSLDGVASELIDSLKWSDHAHRTQHIRYVCRFVLEVARSEHGIQIRGIPQIDFSFT